MATIPTITPCLWFDDQAEEAALFYTSIFEDSRLLEIARYPDAGQEIHGQPPGKVMTVAFELAGQRFTALNGGPAFRFTEAISLQIHCHSQEEVDHYWARLGEEGGGQSVECGWLKDRYGLSWQVIPLALLEMLGDADRARAGRVMEAMLGMQKLDIAALRRAYEE